MAYKKKLKLSKNAQEEFEFMKKYEPYVPLPLFKIRILSLTGYPTLRKELSDIEDYQWNDLYSKYTNG